MLLVIGAGLVLMSSGKRARVAWGSGWLWPVAPARYPDGVLYRPVVTQEFRPGSHLGVDVMYRRRPLSALDRPEVPAGEGGTRVFFAPKGTPIVAARDAIVWSVDKSPRGWQVVLDHGKPFATYYQHLSSVSLSAHAMGKSSAGAVTHVAAGEQIGTMGGDPLDAPQHLRHLHFAVWYEGNGDAASVDPTSAMQSWGYAPAWDVAS